MAGDTKSGISAETLDLYEKLVASIPDVDRKGASMPYTSRNGHMFSFLTKSGTLALRLPAEELDAFLKRYKTTLCEQHGTVMKEYVQVPATLLKKTKELQPYIAASYAYVGALKPKPTKRPAKKTAKKKVPKGKRKQ